VTHIHAITGISACLRKQDNISIDNT